MKEAFSKNVEIKISLNGLITIAVLFAFYFLSYLIPADAQLYKADFSSIIVILIFSLCISAVWLFLYWFLDRLQHEPIKKSLITFCAAAFAQIAFYSLFKCIAWKTDYILLQYILVPLLSFLSVFSLYVIKQDSFDEIVDPFIYGAFEGIGIAFASCLIEFASYEDISIKFIILELITRISVHAAIFSLSCFVLNQALLKKKKLFAVLALILPLVLLLIENLVEIAIGKNIKIANINIIQVVLSFAFILVLVSVTVALIHTILKKTEAAEEKGVKFEDNPFLAKITLVLFAIILISAFCYRKAEAKTVSFVSQDNQWEFKLPVGFTEKEEKTTDSIFNIEVATGNTFYKKGTTDIYIDFNVELESYSDFEKPSYKMYGWSVRDLKNQYVANSGNSNAYILSQYVYVLNKYGKNIYIDVYTEELEESDVKNAIRLLIKTLEAKNE